MKSELTVRKIKAGEWLNPLCAVTEDAQCWSYAGINALIFVRQDYAMISMLWADEPGTGRCREFLVQLKEKLGKNVVVTNVINQNLMACLVDSGIQIV